MENNKIGNVLKKENENIDEELEKKINRDIDEFIKEFQIDSSYLDSIVVPKNIKKTIIKPLKEIKTEKRKNFSYGFLDIFIVTIVLLPIVGCIYPKLFIKVPVAYEVFEKINSAVQIENIKSIMGFGEEVIEGSENSSTETIYIEEKDIEKPKNNNEAIKLIHSLANTLIEAQYKWQCSEVTPKTIEIALDGVEKITNDYDRMHLRNALRKWKKGDFSNSVSVHNYVWEMLGGSVGKADSLDKEAIKTIVNKYYK